MKRIFTFLIMLFVAFALSLPAPAQAEFKDFWARVYTWDGNTSVNGKPILTRLSSGVTYKVLATGSDTAETLYYYDNQAMTSLTNPVSTTNFASDSISRDQVQFRVDPTDADDDKVDLIVTNTNGGHSRFFEDFNYRNDHTIIIDESPGRSHWGTIWFSHTTTGEQDTGIDFRYDTFVSDVRVEVVETCSGCTIDVGTLTGETNQDSDGFRDGTVLTTAGFVADTGIITAGASMDYYPDSTYGAHLYTIIAGAGAHAAATDRSGGRTYMGHVVTGTNAVSLAYTVSSTLTGEGYLYYELQRFR